MSCANWLPGRCRSRGSQKCQVASHDTFFKCTPHQIATAVFAVATGLILPVGYPDSVTPDYLAYQLWAVPSHITGWMGSSVITSSLLAAVGLKAGAGTAAAGAASIRWITKDGIGALGRLLVSMLFNISHT